MVEAGLITLVSFISPFAAERDSARQALGEDEFIEVFVKTSLAEAEKETLRVYMPRHAQGNLKILQALIAPMRSQKLRK